MKSGYKNCDLNKKSGRGLCAKLAINSNSFASRVGLCFSVTQIDAAFKPGFLANNFNLSSKFIYLWLQETTTAGPKPISDVTVAISFKM